MRVQRGKLLVQRFSAGLNPIVNTHDTRPARRGYWAFPWPHGDLMFFAGHKIDEHIRKDLRVDAIAAVEDNDVRERLWAERSTWIRDVAPKVIRVHQMWWDGPIMACFDARGIITRGWLGGGEWNTLNVDEFVKGARRIAHQVNRHPHRWAPEAPLAVHQKISTDHLEIFLPA